MNNLSKRIREKMWQHGIASEDRPKGVDGLDVLALLDEIDKLEEEKAQLTKWLRENNEQN